jgi:hypothetical protein
MTISAQLAFMLKVGHAYSEAYLSSTIKGNANQNIKHRAYIVAIKPYIVERLKGTSIKRPCMSWIFKVFSSFLSGFLYYTLFP